MKAILALFSLLALSSCVTIDRQSKSQLVGDWRYSDETQSCHYSFRPDGSFSGEVARHKRLVLKFTGRWKIESGVLNYVYLTEAFGRIPRGTTDRDQLLEMKRDSFLIQAANGDRRRYLRVY
ncbi:MAG: hypothetical protein ABR611_04840 [Chthoniobacterales bacterium]